MKKQFFIISLILAIATTSFEQTATPSSKFSSDEYLTKSRKQRTAAWVFLGGGFVFTATGFIIGLNSAVEELAYAFNGEKSKKFEAGAILFFTGTAAMLGSIPLFIASSKNKRKGMALSASVKMERAISIQNLSLLRSSYPALSLRLNFK